MITSELLEYIEQEYQHGVSKEQITKTLQENGWMSEDIEEAFHRVDTNGAASDTTATTSRRGVWIAVAGVLVAVIAGVLIAGAYFMTQDSSEDSTANEVEDFSRELEEETNTSTPQSSASVPTTELQNEPQTEQRSESDVTETENTPQPPEETNTPSPQNSAPDPTTEPQTEQRSESDVTETDMGYMVLAERLETCTEYETTFEHPLTGDTMQRNISGIVEDKCVYTEEMPNNGQMTCRYSETQRRAVAEFYRDEAEGGNSGQSSNNGGMGANPLMQAMADDTCVITGYE